MTIFPTRFESNFLGYVKSPKSQVVSLTWLDDLRMLPIFLLIIWMLIKINTLFSVGGHEPKNNLGRDPGKILGHEPFGLGLGLGLIFQKHKISKPGIIFIAWIV